MPDLPRITVVTPSYNQGQYLEQTIRSVLDQDYPQLEYFVVDGGSRDDSKAIIERYSDRLAWWVSEPDRGQPHALNKGLARATGDVIAYINSDDFYTPGALRAVGEFFRDRPETDFLYGGCLFVDEQGQPFDRHRGNIASLAELLDLWNVWWQRRQFVQPECFWSRRIAQHAPQFREDIVNAFDYEYWTRLFLAGAKVARLDTDLASFRFQPNQKSADSDRSAREELAVLREILWRSDVPLPDPDRRRLRADWLYDVHFHRVGLQSVAAGESKPRRWLRLALSLIRHPGIFNSPRFQARRWERAALKRQSHTAE